MGHGQAETSSVPNAIKQPFASKQAAIWFLAGGLALAGFTMRSPQFSSAFDGATSNNITTVNVSQPGDAAFPQVGDQPMVQAASVLAGDESTPLLWVVDHEDAQLAMIQNYLRPRQTMINFGRLHWKQGQRVRPIQVEPGQPTIESMTIDQFGQAWMVIPHDLGRYAGPVLVKIDLRVVQPAGGALPNQVVIAGSLDLPSHGDSSEPPRVVSLMVDTQDESQSKLIALVQQADNSQQPGAIHTFNIDGKSIDSPIPLPAGSQWQDIDMDSSGQLYAMDAAQNRLTMIDLETGSVSQVIDANAIDGLTTYAAVDTSTNNDATPRLQTFAYDWLNERGVSFDRLTQRFTQQTLTDGQNRSLPSVPGLTDVHAMRFMPEDAGFKEEAYPFTPVQIGTERADTFAGGGTTGGGPGEELIGSRGGGGASGGGQPSPRNNPPDDDPLPPNPEEFPEDDPTPEPNDFAVPAPSTPLLIASGLIAMALRRRQRNTSEEYQISFHEQSRN